MGEPAEGYLLGGVRERGAHEQAETGRSEWVHAGPTRSPLRLDRPATPL
jgi:hypothetical protein